MNITPAVKNLVIQRGDDFSFVFDIAVDDVVLDLSGYTIVSQIRTQADNSATLIETFTTSVNGSNEVTLSLTDVQTAAIAHSSGYYDVLFCSAGGDITHYLKGSVTFTGTVTESLSSVVIATPADGSSHVAPATITYAATVTTGAGRTISDVKFYANDTLLNTDTSAPYSYSWTGVTADSYDLYVTVTDDKGTYTSDTISITVA